VAYEYNLPVPDFQAPPRRTKGIDRHCGSSTRVGIGGGKGRRGDEPLGRSPWLLRPGWIGGESVVAGGIYKKAIGRVLYDVNLGMSIFSGFERELERG
jgi:hypothetical protein